MKSEDKDSRHHSAIGTDTIVKKAYVSPKLRMLGTVQKLTLTSANPLTK